MVTVAVANCTSVTLVLQFEFGQPASLAVGVGGGCVVTQALKLPFLIWVDGIVIEPLGLTGVLFWPGAVLPPWFVQSVVALPVVLTVMVTSPLPRPARLKQVVKVVPLSVKVGLPPLK